MTSEANDLPADPPPADGGSDRAGSEDAGFQKTEWAPGNQPRSADDVPTQIVAPPPALAPAPAPAAPPADDMGGHLPAGTRFGELEILGLIGEGGFGIVYLAQDHSLQRRVALKEYMPTSLAVRNGNSQVQVKSARHRETFEAGLKSFINEARLLASFDHPALVRVYRFWEQNGTAYMVMPYLDGTTLKDVLRSLGRRPDEGWLRSVLGPVTEALQVIHAQQCYHRDIAPDNIMLLPAANRWLLLDFGAARRVIGDMTQALTVILKPGYAPVEQYAEIPGMKQGPWTDVYALAAVIYYAIVGRTPPPSVGRLLNDTYVPLAQSAAGRYSAGFLAAVDRALAVRPEARTQTIDDLRRDLGLDEPAPAPAAPSRSAEPTAVAPPLPAAPAAATTPVRPPAAPAAADAARPQAPGARAAPAAADAPAHAPEPARSRAGLGIAIGVGVLAVLGVGGYLLSGRGTPPPAAPVAAPPDVAQAAAPANAPGSAPVPAAAVVAAAPAPAPAQPATFDVPQEFQRVVQAAQPGFDVRLQTNQQRYRIGKDELSFTVRAERDGYAHVYIHGTDGVLLQLYPTAKQGALKVRKGQVLSLPPPGVRFATTGPAGPTDLLVTVSANPRDHAAMKPRKEGDILVFPTGPEAAALAAAIPGPLPALAGRAVCPAGAASCDEAYGAALVRVEVVP